MVDRVSMGCLSCCFGDYAARSRRATKPTTPIMASTAVLGSGTAMLFRLILAPAPLNVALTDDPSSRLPDTTLPTCTKFEPKKLNVRSIAEPILIEPKKEPSLKLNVAPTPELWKMSPVMVPPFKFKVWLMPDPWITLFTTPPLTISKVLLVPLIV